MLLRIEISLPTKEDLESRLLELSQFLINFSDLKKYQKNLSIEVIFVNDVEMREINKEYRDKDYTTDVLSFPLSIDSKILQYLSQGDEVECIGNIIINVDFAKRVAKELAHSVESEIELLFIHGMLHLLGFDHEVDHGEQREIERETIVKFNLPESLVMRVDNE